MLLNQFLQRRRFIGIGLLSLIAALNSAAFAQEATQDRNAISIADLTSLNVQLTSRQFIGPAGLTAEKLAEEAFARSRELLAARQTLEIAKGRLLQAGLRPNPSIGVEQTTDYLTGRSGEGNTGVGVTQVFELGGKPSKRVAVAQLEYDRAVADVRALERQIAAEIRSAYAQALAAARQLDIAERLIALDQELARVTEARLKKGMSRRSTSISCASKLTACTRNRCSHAPI